MAARKPFYLNPTSHIDQNKSLGENKRKPSSFSIDNILGLDLRKNGTPAANPHQTQEEKSQNLGEYWYLCLGIPAISYAIPLFNASNYSEAEEKLLKCENYFSVNEGLSFKPDLEWYRHRRPRTSFTKKQIEALENVFITNVYPGIDVREKLAKELNLDEDRVQHGCFVPRLLLLFQFAAGYTKGIIGPGSFGSKILKQIWFQNRRAKVKRSLRESQFLMVKNTFSQSMVE